MKHIISSTDQLGGQFLGFALAALAAIGLTTIAEASATQEGRTRGGPIDRGPIDRGAADRDAADRDADIDRPTFRDPVRDAAGRMVRASGIEMLAAADRFRRMPEPIQRRVAGELGRMEDDRAVPVLVELMVRSDDRGRDALGDALRRQTRVDLPNSPELWSNWLEGERTWLRVRGEELVRELRGTDEALVVMATREIADHRFARRGFAAELERNLGRRSIAIRSVSARSLGDLAALSSAGPLRRSMDDPADAVRREAADSLRRMDR